MKRSGRVHISLFIVMIASWHSKVSNGKEVNDDQSKGVNDKENNGKNAPSQGVKDSRNDDKKDQSQGEKDTGIDEKKDKSQGMKDTGDEEEQDRSQGMKETRDGEKKDQPQGEKQTENGEKKNQTQGEKDTVNSKKINQTQEDKGTVKDKKDECNVERCDFSKVLTRLLDGYDKRLRPFIDDHKPVTITVGLWILSIDSINVVDMDYQIDFFLRQSWEDPRLKYGYTKKLTVTHDLLEKIWTPDTYFENSKHSVFHFVTVPNKMIRLSPNGKVEYNARISVRASCPMDLRHFPVDSQQCHLHIESYGYSTNHINYTWEQHANRVSIGQKVKYLPQYHLYNFTATSMVTEWVVGNFSSLKASFMIERQYGHFFLHLYAPCAMIVMLSWISFFIPKEAIAARIALSITAVLTTTTVLNMQNKALPKVSYIKLADWYLIISFIFVFGVFIEYTVILYITKRDAQKNAEKAADKKNQPGNDKVKDCNCRVLDESFPKYGFSIKAAVSSVSNVGGYTAAPTILELIEGKKTPQREKKKKTLCNCSKMACSPDFDVDMIDEYACKLFPLAFLIFNCIYWLFFFTKKRR